MLRASPAPGAAFDVVLLDLDGVVYVGPDAVPHAVATLRVLAAGGARLAFVTNNAARPADAVAAHLSRLGIPVGAADVVTSAQAGAALLRDRLPGGAAVLAIGGPGVAAALDEVGLRPVASAADGPQAVLQGYGPDVGWRALAEGAYALATGVPWVATNTDRTIPTPRGIAPGNGTLVEVLRLTSGRDPIVAGKPAAPLLLEAVARTGAHRALMVGDRLDTDVAGAHRAGLPALAVLTGVTTVPALAAAAASERPDLVALDLRGLIRPHAAPHRDGSAWVCGGWRLDVLGQPWTLTRDEPGRGSRADAAVAVAGLPGPERIADLEDQVRAVLAACWWASDHGEPVRAGLVLGALERAVRSALAGSPDPPAQGPLG